MEHIEADKAVQQLVIAFSTLQDEYRGLHAQHQALERKLATAREQYSELAKICGSGANTTPPLSLASSPARKQHDAFPTQTTLQLLRTSDRQDAAIKVEAGVKAAQTLRTGIPKRPGPGVRIWSGPSADMQEGGSSALHSISESPLEQDFTVEGKPSQLGCPFASMANKKLSSHAASVLSRYKGGSAGASVSQLGADSVHRVNGKESLSRRGSRRASFVDPIKAEICGLSDHQEHGPASPKHEVQPTVDPQEEPGVCPIRFLDQHSPEEVATYFEKHKHELPRSHEICVKRYQSNEQQIRQLDEKYGNLVSMIQGLGAKHKGMLPPEPEDDEENGLRAESTELEEKDAEKVRKWASSVSAQVGEAAGGEQAVLNDDVERQQHFERPLRDIRVGESPSRPWGISVPPKYLDKAGSEASSQPVQVASSPLDTAAAKEVPNAAAKADTRGKCPFGFDQAGTKAPPKPAAPSARANSKPAAFAHADDGATAKAADAARPSQARLSSPTPQMVFNGPVFFGYSAEDAAKVLREGGLAG